jgi:ADP-ribosylglycohydrolase
MNKDSDKILGCWFGLAVGEAMGTAARGCKAGAVSQMFGPMDDYKDVAPYVGKGVKRYRMKGLYGAISQCALVVCDQLLQTKKIELPLLIDRFVELSYGDSEEYFGCYRRPEGLIKWAISNISEPEENLEIKVKQATGACLTIGIPIAMFSAGNLKVIRKQTAEITNLFTNNALEIVGAVTTGFLADYFVSGRRPFSPSPDNWKTLLDDAIQFCQETEAWLIDEQLLPSLQGNSARPLLISLECLRDNFDKPLDKILESICKTVSETTENPVSHSAQGRTEVLLPAALACIAKSDNQFLPGLSAVLNKGGEADKLGALTGSFAGAVYGFSSIPENIKSGLVNFKEIRSRGEALSSRRNNNSLKDLFEMESSLTKKENDQRQRFLQKEPKKKSKSSKTTGDIGASDSSLPKKEKKGQWRKFQKDKTKQKRDRRRNLPSTPDPDSEDDSIGDIK